MLHTHEHSDTTGYIKKQQNFCNVGQIVTWCTCCLGLPVHHKLSGFGIPVPLFIGYLISNLILLKTNLPLTLEPANYPPTAGPSHFYPLPPPPPPSTPSHIHKILHLCPISTQHPTNTHWLHALHFPSQSTGT